ncbi:MAG: acyl-CoA dehydrogenase [Pelagimonas sp.]|jgi:alkylation response protein AidB-like acyl-CoA dehydrogenase|nr:acyl-CoA dehydrogenase [Pelagimonas sp.]
MTYQAPLKDILFNLEHLSQWDKVTALPDYEDITQEDAGAALEALGRFCAEQIAPLAKIGDEAHAQHKDGKVILPQEFHDAYAQFVEMGWQSLVHPADHGGMGLPKVVGGAAAEIVNGADMSFGLCPLLTDGAIEALLLSGSDEQKATYLEPLISGQWTGTMNLTEPQAGSDLGRVRTKAEPNGDGTFAITGTKIFITFGEHDLAENIVHLVLARTPNGPAGPKGLSLYIVPKFMVEADGSLGDRNSVECVSIEDKLGVRASPTAVLQYNAAKGFLIGEENRGLEYMFIMMNAARFSVGVQGVAVSERAYQHALAYAQDRVQSRPVDGSVKDAVAIIHHPDIRRILLKMRAMTEGGRALAMAAAGWLDLAHHTGDQATTYMAEFMVPLVKGFCTEKSLEVTSLGVQCHGGMGFIEETGVAQWYRDARILPIYEGTTAIQANDLLGRKVLRDGGETAQRFSAMVQDTIDALSQGGAQAQVIAKGLAQAKAQFDESLAWLLSNLRENPNFAFAGTVPFLMLTGNLAAGWQMGRAALVAQDKLAAGEDKDFMADKLAMAQFYAQHILVEAATEAARIQSGADAMYEDGLVL